MQSPQQRRCGCLLVACLAWSDPAFAQRSETVDVPTPSPASIRIIRVSPIPREAVSRQTIIEVELAFNVERFEKSRFRLGATAAQNRLGHSWMVQEAGKGDTVLEEAAGQVTARFALASIWDKDDVKVPLEIKFSVDQLFGTMGASTMAATTEPVVYTIEGPPPVAPADALTREPVTTTYDEPRGMTTVQKNITLFRSAGTHTVLGLGAQIPGREVVKPPADIMLIVVFQFDSGAGERPPAFSTLTLSVDGRQISQRPAIRASEETTQGVYTGMVASTLPAALFANLVQGTQIEMNVGGALFSLTQSQLAALREFAGAIKVP
jgi:hypothetical protein